MLKFSMAAAGLAFLTGCSALPSAGPTADEVTSQASAEEFQRYAVLDITPAVNAVLQRRPPENMLANFGDHRPPVASRIGIGDIVAVTIWEASAGGLFSAPLVTDRFSSGSKSATIPEQAVGRDGSITVPYGGRVSVAGLTVDAAQQRVETSIAGKAIQPQAIISITRPVSSSVTVTGEVAAGARVPLSVKGDRLMDVIATAGGVRIPVNEAAVQLSRGSRTVRVALSRVVADPRENIYMRPDDVVTVVRQPQTYIAYGATGRNAEIPFESDTVTLAQALAKAGGLIDSRSDPAGVFVLRYEPHAIARQLVPDSPLLQAGGPVPVVYRFNLRDADNLFMAQRFQIHAKDLLYVSNAPLSDMQKALSLFYTVAGPALSGVGIYNVTR
ncbi:polysaccharide biosynthesis/export family protein [Bosea sp. Root381]|uniref:polysaccharide biosynthesis/export family protein n=1 Tax=Bosea sp. Root381 TaxID=1736524 RepID=UPI001FCD20E0|nr:polysaccharide biosynthesis/export family protein [Bosea sp. Root381]